MQRTIKFRGKIKKGEGFIDEGKWVHGDLIQRESDNLFIMESFEGGFDATEHVYPIQSETLGQYTGLTDKKDRRIYEGDILKYKSQNPKYEGKSFNNVVEFASGQSLVGWRMRNKSTIVRATPYKFYCSKIIGNIHDNPELLK